MQTFVYGSSDVEALPCIAGGGGHGLLSWVERPQRTTRRWTATSSAPGTTVPLECAPGSLWRLGAIDGVSLAYDPDSNTGIYAFAIFPENNPAVSSDQIYIMKYDGTNWGSPIQVTHNNVANANPKVTYINGNPMLVWWSGGQIDYCDDLDTLDIQVADASPSMSQDFTLANNGSTLAVVGGGQSDSGRDLYCLPYDVASGLWGGETRLTASSGTAPSTVLPAPPFGQR